MAEFYTGDRVKSDGRRGTVTGKAGNWEKTDERGYYSVRFDGAKGRVVIHKSKLTKA